MSEAWHSTASVFDVLLPNSTSLLHYIWPLTASPDIPLKLQDTLPLPIGSIVQDTAISLIQSWQTPDALEALARVTTQNGDDTLIAFQFTPGINQPTSFPVTSDGVINRVTGSPALIQNDQQMFELLVPRADGLFHYTHTNQTLAGPWQLVQTLPASGNLKVASIGFAQTDGNGGMVAVALDRNTSTLFSYTYDSQRRWQRPIPVNINNAPVAGVIGTPALFASNTSEGQERLELLVPTTAGLLHLINAPDAPANHWQLVERLKPLSDNRTITPVLASLVQTEPGKLQAFVRAETSDGQFLLITYSYNRATGWSGPAKLQVPDASTKSDTGNSGDGGDTKKLDEKDKPARQITGVSARELVENANPFRDEVISEILKKDEDEAAGDETIH
jgi:hypothetical protein